MSDYAVEVDNVTIRFNMASEKVDNLKEYVIKLLKKELIFQEFLAVKDVSFKVKKGEAWALIGVNGSGKSTRKYLSERYRSRTLKEIYGRAF